MEARVVLIKHSVAPDDDRVVGYFRSAGISPEILYPFKGDILSDFDERVVGSVIYGGPFNVYETDRHEFLLEEHRWAEICMKKSVPLLGICQGAQSIAYVLGAHVGPKEGLPHEFGYYPIYPTEEGKDLFPAKLHVAQSHFHEFHIPSGATHLAFSDLFVFQAMKYGKETFAFQFHAEVTRAGFARWQGKPNSYFGKPGAQDLEEQNRLGDRHDPSQHVWFMKFLDDLFGPHLRERGLSAPDGADGVSKTDRMKPAVGSFGKAG
ncbi:MAG: hypothetical protein R3245_04570 [Kiloniellales bacterium]|nr:hypothetical protein [Kiloniellales bacterium]